MSDHAVLSASGSIAFHLQDWNWNLKIMNPMLPLKVVLPMLSANTNLKKHFT